MPVAFLIAVTNYLAKGNIRKEGFTLTRSERVQSSMMAAESEGSGSHGMSIGEQRER